MRWTPGKQLACRISAAVVLVAATVWAVTAPPQATPEPRIIGEIQHFSLVGNPRAPAPFHFIDGEGRRRGLEDFRGKVVMINFWATWCAPCVREMPALDTLAAAMKGRPFALVALNEDRQGASVARPFLDRLGLKSTALYLDPGGQAQRALGVGALPTTVVFDGRGRELGRLVGPADWASAEARALIAHFIANDR